MLRECFEGGNQSAGIFAGELSGRELKPVPESGRVFRYALQLERTLDELERLMVAAVDRDIGRLHVTLRAGRRYGTDVNMVRSNGATIGPFGSTTSAKRVWNFSSVGKESSHLPQSLKLAKSQ